MFGRFMVKTKHRKDSCSLTFNGTISSGFNFHELKKFHSSSPTSIKSLRRTKRHIHQEMAEWDEEMDDPSELVEAANPTWDMQFNSKEGIALL